MCCTSRWKCDWFEKLGSTKVMSVGVKNVTWRFCQFYIWNRRTTPVLEELLPISMRSDSRTISCSSSVFCTLSHSLSKCWHAFCHTRGWQRSDISHAGPAKWQEHNGAKRTSCPPPPPPSTPRTNERSKTSQHSPVSASWLILAWQRKYFEEL